MADRLCMGCMEVYEDKYDICPYCGYKEGAPAKEAIHLAPGTVIGNKYIVGQSIGNGGFGVTYIGWDAVLNQKIAIKEYLPSEFSTRAMGVSNVTIFTGQKEEQFLSGVNKFMDEARRLAKFKGVSGIVDIHDTFQANNTAYIIMEYIDGETLKERLEREGKIPYEEALKIMKPVVEALKEVHKEGILHRDISPDNIMISKDGDVKIIDFGAARYATTGHSRSLSVLVKPGYAPQEQYRSRGDQGTWTDVYACAATLYKMITGVTPEDSMERELKDTLVAPSKLGVKIPKNIENAILNAMNLQIEDRTQTAEDFENDLFSDKDVKRNKVHIRKMDIGKWPLWVKIASGIGTAAVVTCIVLLLTGVIRVSDMFHGDSGNLSDGYVYAPNIINTELDEAEKKVSEAKLIMQITDKKNDSVIPENLVLTQNIPGGEVVKEKTVMAIVVSAGEQVTYMPDIEGLEKDAVVDLLINMGWTQEDITIEDKESDVAPGYVAELAVADGKTIACGDEIAVGTKMVIYISTGRKDYDSQKQTTVPDVCSKSWGDAMQTLASSKLYIYKLATEYSDTVPKGNIISQNPTAKETTTEGEKVGVVVSLGKQEDAKIHVPDVQYKSREQAIAILEAQGLKVQIQDEESNTVQKDHVIRQSVEAGTEVAGGTTIVIYISLGNSDAVLQYEGTTDETTTEKGSTTEKKETTEKQDTTEQKEDSANKDGIPNVVGLNIYAARDKLWDCEQIDNMYGGNIVVLNAYKPGVADGIVFAQSPGSQFKTYITQHYSSEFAGSYLNDDWSDCYVIYVSDSQGWTYYRYRDVVSYEETTSTSNVPPEGFEYYKSENSDTYGDWSDWSEWGVDPVAASDVCNVEEDSSTGTILYRYQTREKTTTTTYYFRKPIYGEWSSWSESQYYPSDTRQVEERYEEHMIHPALGFFA